MQLLEELRKEFESPSYLKVTPDPNWCDSLGPPEPNRATLRGVARLRQWQPAVPCCTHIHTNLFANLKYPEIRL